MLVKFLKTQHFLYLAKFERAEMFCKKTEIMFNPVKEFDTDGRSNETFRSETSHGYRRLLPTMERIYRVR